MARKSRAVEIARKQSFSAAVAKKFFETAVRAWEYKHATDFVNLEAAAETGINETSLGEIRRGKRQAQPYQCLAIAHKLEVPVEDVLHAEGYPDVTALIALVEMDTTPRHPGEQQYVLDMLKVALRSKAWKKADWHENLYKQKADFHLCSELDEYTKAAFYADEVHDFHLHLRDEMSRWQRRTDEIMTIVS